MGKRLVLGFVCGLMLAGAGAEARSPLAVRVQSEPLNVNESEVRSNTTQTITGPGGTRTTTIDGNTQQRRILTHQSVDSVQDINVSGVNEPGLKVERKLFIPTQPGIGVPGGIAVITTNSPDGSDRVISGGPGSVHTETHTTSNRTPNVQVQIGK